MVTFKTKTTQSCRISFTPWSKAKLRAVVREFSNQGGSSNVFVNELSPEIGGLLKRKKIGGESICLAELMIVTSTLKGLWNKTVNRVHQVSDLTDTPTSTLRCGLPYRPLPELMGNLVNGKLSENLAKFS